MRALVATTLAVLTLLAAAVAHQVTTAEAARARATVAPGPIQRSRHWPTRTPAVSAAALATMLDDVARRVRAGEVVSTAAASVGSTVPIPGLARAVAAAARGATFARGCEDWVATAPTPHERLAATALALAASTGGRPGRVLHAAAATLHERVALAAEVRVQTASARASALALGLLAPAFTAFTERSDPRVGRFLFSTPAGWACLLAGLGLQAAGLAWMALLTRPLR